MARLSAALALPLLVATLVAGCFGGSTVESNPTTTTPATTTPTDGKGGFAIEGLRLLPEDGRDRPLREDDRATLAFTLRHTEGGGRASYFVSILVNGDVDDVSTVTLDEGEAKPFERDLGALWDVRSLDVEVRAGGRAASAEADVLAWPRTGETVDLGYATVSVARWLKNATEGVDVNVTYARKAAPDGAGNAIRSHLLCAEGAGKVTRVGYHEAVLPEPGAAGMRDLHFPSCPDILYGVDFAGEDAQGRTHFVRVLFVEPGWRPPDLET